MRFYNVDMKGKFWHQRGPSDPASDPSNEGRTFYNETTELLKVHNSSAWDAIVTESNAPSLIGGDFLRKDQDDLTTYSLTAYQMYSSVGSFRSTTGTVVLNTSDALNFVRVIDGVSVDFGINGAQKMIMDASGNLQMDGTLTVSGASGTINGNTIWHAGNDGPGSGLNADLLDSQSSAYYRNASNINAGTLPVGRLSGTYNINITGSARYA